MAQQRIRDLDVYTQLESGDVGYVAPSAIYIALDSSSYTGDPKRFALSNLISDTHVEKGRLSGLSSRSVSVTFDSAFSGTPIAVTFEVYRYSDIGGGKYVKQRNVAYYLSGASWVTTTGFAIEIDTSESLTGLFVEYYFVEAT